MGKRRPTNVSVVEPSPQAEGVATPPLVAEATRVRDVAVDAALYLSALIENSEDAGVSKDLDGVITSWNKGAEDLFGYTAAEAVGRPVTILLPAERAGEELRILSEIHKGHRIPPYETVRRRK